MSNKEQVTVDIDANEASQKPELSEKLIMHEDAEDFNIKPLEDGDFIIGNMMFERKTPSDFASSIENSHLRDQVDRMAATDYIPVILVEGDMEDYDHLTGTEIPSKSCRGMDASIEMRNNITVKYCSNLKNLVDVAIRMARKEKEEDVSGYEFKESEAMKDLNFMESVFFSVDKVGVQKAIKLASEFPTLQKALNATIDDFESIEGIGETISNEIYTTVHAEEPEKEEQESHNVTEEVVTI